MAYIEGRLVHDADAHIMETATWLQDYADPQFRELIETPDYTNELRQLGDNDAMTSDVLAALDQAAEMHRSDEYRAEDEAQIMMRDDRAPA